MLFLTNIVMCSIFCCRSTTCACTATSSTSSPPSSTRASPSCASLAHSHRAPAPLLKKLCSQACPRIACLHGCRHMCSTPAKVSWPLNLDLETNAFCIIRLRFHCVLSIVFRYSKVGLLRKLLAETSRERAEWILWIDADTIVQELAFQMPLHLYTHYSFVVWGNEDYLLAGDQRHGDLVSIFKISIAGALARDRLHIILDAAIQPAMPPRRRTAIRRFLNYTILIQSSCTSSRR